MSRTFVLAVTIGAMALAGCDLQLTAEQITVRMEDGDISLVGADEGFRGGEIVITVENYTPERRQPVLAETTLRATELPEELATARSTEDGDDIVAVGGIMRPAKATIVGFQPVTEPSVVKLHINLEPGTRYLLFDGRGGADEGLAIELVPEEG